MSAHHLSCGGGGGPAKNFLSGGGEGRLRWLSDQLGRDFLTFSVRRMENYGRDQPKDTKKDDYQ